MARITSTKELQTVCDDLYDLFVKRFAQVTEIEKVCGEHGTDVYFHIVKSKHCDNCLEITKYNNGIIAFWADRNNGLCIGAYSDHDGIEIFRTSETINDRGFSVLEKKQYTNKNGQKTADLKKRAILLNLKEKLEVLFKDYL